jgi:hypothetical protein
METINWAEIVVLLLGLTSAGTRFIAWIRDSEARRKFCHILAEALERLANTGDSAYQLKTSLDVTTAKVGGRVRAIADSVAAVGEASINKEGSATYRVSKAKKFLTGLKKWAPIVGAFL